MIDARKDVQRLRRVATKLADLATLLEDLAEHEPIQEALWECRMDTRTVLRNQAPHKWLTTSERMEVLD